MSDWGIVTARFLQFGSALILFGSPVFYLYGLKGRVAGWPARRWEWPNLFLLIAAAGLFLGTVWWVVAQAAVVFSDADVFDPDAIWILLTDTRFGRVSFLRLGLVVLSAVGLALLSPGRTAWIVQSVLGGAVVASFAWTGHGIRDEGLAGLVHLGGDVLHLLTAGIWVGALIPLSFLVLHSLRKQTEANARASYAALEGFSGIGPAVVLILILTGLLNSWFLVGSARWPELFTSFYGLTLLVKLLLFGAMIVLAAGNRFWLLPQLSTALKAADSIPTALRGLRRSIVAETGLAFLVLFAVALLGTLKPPGSP